MPTRYWLVGPTEVLAVSRLESAGGVRRAEAEVDAAAIADAHRRYAAERDADAAGRRDDRRRRAASAARARASSACTPTTPGTSPAATTRSGAGSRARLADAARRRRRPRRRRRSRHAGRDTRIPVGPASLLRRRPRRPRPADAGAADQRHRPGHRPRRRRRARRRPAIVDAHDVHVRGDEPWHLATVERGGPPDGAERRRRPRGRRGRVPRPGHRDAAPTAWHNPGLDPARVDTVLGTCCVVVAVMRRLQLPRLTIEAPGG